MSPAAPIKSGASSSILSQISEAKSQINRTQQLLLVTLGMGILTLAIGALMIQVPWQDRRRQLTSLYGEEKERSELLLAIQRQRADLEGIEKSFLLKGGAPGLGSLISELAAQSGLQIDSVTPLPEVVAGPYTRFQLEILAAGNLANVMIFLRTLEDHRPLLWVEQMDMGDPPAETFPSFTAFGESSGFQPKERQKVRFLIGAITRQSDRLHGIGGAG